MRLVACSNCHTQYDVTDIEAERFPCRCGEQVENRTLAAVDAGIHRCGSCGALVQADAEACSYCGSAIVRDPRKLSLICPECYARNADDARFCTACGVGFQPQKVEIDGREMPCPVCSVLMQPRGIAGVGLNECAQCNGLWVPGESFDVLVRRAIEARRAAAQDGLAGLAQPAPRVSGANPAAQRVVYRKCPVCDALMLRRNFRKSSGVIMDVCHEHGTWLDADELEQIAGFILSGGTTSPTLLEDERSAAQRRAVAAFARIQGQAAARIERREEGSVAGSFLDVLTRLLT